MRVRLPLIPVPIARTAAPLPLVLMPIARTAAPLPLIPVPIARTAAPLPLVPMPIARTAAPLPLIPMPIARTAAPLPLIPMPIARTAAPLPLIPMPIARKNVPLALHRGSLGGVCSRLSFAAGGVSSASAGVMVGAGAASRAESARKAKAGRFCIRAIVASPNLSRRRASLRCRCSGTKKSTGRFNFFRKCGPVDDQYRLKEGRRDRSTPLGAGVVTPAAFGKARVLAPPRMNGAVTARASAVRLGGRTARGGSYSLETCACRYPTQTAAKEFNGSLSCDGGSSCHRRPPKRPAYPPQRATRQLDCLPPDFRRRRFRRRRFRRRRFRSRP